MVRAERDLDIYLESLEEKEQSEEMTLEELLETVPF